MMSERTNLVLRGALASDVPVLAKIWHEGWQDGHAGLVPDKLARNRTLDSFADRLANSLAQVRVAELEGEIVGFHVIQEDELNQFFLAAEARGRGVADVMMADAEAGFRAAGHARAWLACAIGNDRAARFYEKQGWGRTGVVTSHLPTRDGVVDLEVWRYEKMVTSGG
ncbi:MAG: GNAT family N-acetyltransferase [Alphaproteobacteria bacterium]|nr:GNAT family N-acetyltransferase [Alphaproteobacteria bacterium]